MPGLPIYPDDRNAAAYEKQLREVFLTPLIRSFSEGLAETASARELLRKLQDEDYTPEFADGVPRDQIRDAMQRMAGYHDRQLIQTFRQGLGVNVSEIVRDQGEVEAFLRQKVRENMELIVTIPPHLHDDLIERFNEIIDAGGFIDEEQTAAMVARVGHVGGYTLRRIVRDQNSKVTGNLTEIRHRQIGIERYRWSTSQDDRVRPLHAALNGTERSWDNPHPTEGHPGHAIQCRCAAIPVVTKPLRRRQREKHPERELVAVQELSAEEIKQLERMGYVLETVEDRMAPPTDFQSLRLFLQRGYDRVVKDTILVREGIVSKTELRRVFKTANEHWMSWDLDSLVDDHTWLKWLFRVIAHPRSLGLLRGIAEDTFWEGAAIVAPGGGWTTATARASWEVFRGDPIKSVARRFAQRRVGWVSEAAGRAAVRYRLLDRMGLSQKRVLFYGFAEPPRAPKQGETRGEWVEDRIKVLSKLSRESLTRAELQREAYREYRKFFGEEYVGEPTYDGHTRREDWIEARLLEIAAHYRTLKKWRKRGDAAINKEARRIARLEWFQGRWTGWRPSGLLDPWTPPPRTPTREQIETNPIPWLDRRMRELLRYNRRRGMTEQGALEYAKEEFAGKMWERFDPFIAARKYVRRDYTPAPKRGKGKTDWIRKQSRVYRRADPEITSDEAYLRSLRDWLRNQFEPPEPVIKAGDTATLFVVRRTRELFLFDPDRFADESARLRAWLEWRNRTAEGEIPTPRFKRSPRSDDHQTTRQHRSTLTWEDRLREEHADELAEEMTQDGVVAFVQRLWRRHGKQAPPRLTFAEAVDGRIVDMRGGDEIVFYLRSGEDGDAADAVRMTKAQVMHAVTSVLLDRADDAADPVLRGETFASLMLRLYESEVREVPDPARLASGVRFADDVDDADWVRKQARAQALSDWLVLHHSGDRPRVRLAGAPAGKYASEHRELPYGARGRNVGKPEADRPAGFRSDVSRMDRPYSGIPIFGPASRARRRLSPETPPPEDYVLPPVWEQRTRRPMVPTRAAVRWLREHEQPQAWIDRRAQVIRRHNPELTHAEAVEEAMLEWSDLFSEDMARMRPGDLYRMLHPNTPQPRFTGYIETQGEGPWIPWIRTWLDRLHDYDRDLDFRTRSGGRLLEAVFLAHRTDELMRWNPILSRPAARVIAEKEMARFERYAVSEWQPELGRFDPDLIDIQRYASRGQWAGPAYDAPDVLMSTDIYLDAGGALQVPAIRASDRRETWVPKRKRELMDEVEGLGAKRAEEWASAEWSFFAAQQDFIDPKSRQPLTLAHGDDQDLERRIARMYTELQDEGLLKSPDLTEQEIKRLVRHVWRRYGISTPPELFFRSATAREAEEGMEAVFHRGAIHFLGDWDDELPATVPRYVVLHELAHALHQRALMSTDELPQAWQEAIGAVGPAMGGFAAQQHNQIFWALVVAMLDEFEGIPVRRGAALRRDNLYGGVLPMEETMFDFPNVDFIGRDLPHIGGLGFARDNARLRGMSEEAIMRGVDDEPVVIRGMPDDMRERMYGRDRSVLTPPAKPVIDQYGLEHDLGGVMYQQAFQLREVDQRMPAAAQGALHKLELSWRTDPERYQNMLRHLERIEEVVAPHLPGVSDQIVRRVVMIRMAQMDRLPSVPDSVLSDHTPTPIGLWHLTDPLLKSLWGRRRNMEVTHANPFMPTRVSELRAQDELDLLVDKLDPNRKERFNVAIQFEYTPMPVAKAPADGETFATWGPGRIAEIMGADPSETRNGARIIAQREYQLHRKGSDLSAEELPYTPLNIPLRVMTPDYPRSYYLFESFLQHDRGQMLKDEDLLIDHVQAAALIDEMWGDAAANLPLRLYARPATLAEKEKDTLGHYHRGAIHYLTDAERLEDVEFNKRILIHEVVHAIMARAVMANVADPEDLGRGISTTEAILGNMVDHTPEYAGYVMRMFMKHGVLKEMTTDELEEVLRRYNRWLSTVAPQLPALEVMTEIVDTGWARRNMRKAGVPEDMIMDGVDDGVLVSFSREPGTPIEEAKRSRHLDDLLNFDPYTDDDELLGSIHAYPLYDMEELPELLAQKADDHLASRMDDVVAEPTRLVDESAQERMDAAYQQVGAMRRNLSAPSADQTPPEWISQRLERWMREFLKTHTRAPVDPTGQRLADELSLEELVATLQVVLGEQQMRALMEEFQVVASVEFAKHYSHLQDPERLHDIMIASLPADADFSKIFPKFTDDVDLSREDWVGLVFKAILEGGESRAPLNHGALYRALEYMWVASQELKLRPPGLGIWANTDRMKEQVARLRPPKVPPMSLGGFDKFDPLNDDPLSLLQGRTLLYEQLNPADQVFAAKERIEAAVALEMREFFIGQMDSRQMHLLMGSITTPYTGARDARDLEATVILGNQRKLGPLAYFDDITSGMALGWRATWLKNNPGLQPAWAERGRDYQHMLNVYTFEDALDQNIGRGNIQLPAEAGVKTDGWADDRWLTAEEAVELHHELWREGGAYRVTDLEFRPSREEQVGAGEALGYTVQGRLTVFVYNRDLKPPPGVSAARVAANKRGIWVERRTVMHETAHSATHRYFNADAANPYGILDTTRAGLVLTSIGEHGETFEGVKWSYWNHVLGTNLFGRGLVAQLKDAIFDAAESQGVRFEHRNLFVNDAAARNLQFVREGVALRTGESIEDIAADAAIRGKVTFVDEPPHPGSGLQITSSTVRRADDGDYKPHSDFDARTKPTPSYDPDKDDVWGWLDDRAAHILETNDDVRSAEVARRSAMREFAEVHSLRVRAATLARLVPEHLQGWRYTDLPGMTFGGSQAVFLAQHARDIAAEMAMLSDDAAIKAARNLQMSPSNRRSIPEAELPAPNTALPYDEALAELAEAWQRTVPALDEAHARMVAMHQLDEALERKGPRDKGFGRLVRDEKHNTRQNEIVYNRWEDLMALMSNGRGWRGWGGSMDDELTPRQAVDLIRAVWRRYGIGAPPRVVFRARRRGDGGGRGSGGGLIASTINGAEIHFFVDDDVLSLIRTSGAGPEAAYGVAATMGRASDIVHELAHAIIYRSLRGSPGDPKGGVGGRTAGHGESFVAFAAVLHKEVFGIDLERLRIFARESWFIDGRPTGLYYNPDIATGQWARRNLMAKGATAEEVYGDVNARIRVYFDPLLDPNRRAPRGYSQDGSSLWWSFRRGYKERDMDDEARDHRRARDGPYKPHASYSAAAPEEPPFDRAQDDPREWIRTRAEQLHTSEPDLPTYDEARRSAAREFAEKHSERLQPVRLVELLPEALQRFRYLQLPGMTAEQSLDIWTMQTAHDIAREVDWVSDLAAARVAQYMRQQVVEGKAKRFIPDVPLPEPQVESVPELGARWIAYMSSLEHYTAHYIAAMQMSRRRGWKGNRGFHRYRKDERFYDGDQRDAIYAWEKRVAREWLRNTTRHNIREFMERWDLVDGIPEEDANDYRIDRLIEDILVLHDPDRYPDGPPEGSVQEVLGRIWLSRDEERAARGSRYFDMEAELYEIVEHGWGMSANDALDFIRRVWRKAGLGPPPKIIFAEKRYSLYDVGGIAFWGDEIMIPVHTPEVGGADGRVVQFMDVMHELAHIITMRGLEGSPGDVLANKRRRFTPGHSETFAGILRALYHEIMGVPMEVMRIDRIDSSWWRPGSGTYTNWDFAMAPPRFNDDVQTLQWARLNFMSKGGSAEEAYGDVNAPLRVFYEEGKGLEDVFTGSAVRPLSELTEDLVYDPRQRFAAVRAVLRLARHGGIDGHRIRRPRAVDGAYKPWRAFSSRTPEPEEFNTYSGDPEEWIERRAPQILDANDDVEDIDVARMSAAREFADRYSERMREDILAQRLAGKLEYILPELELPFGASRRYASLEIYRGRSDVLTDLYSAQLQSQVPWVTPKAAQGAATWLEDAISDMKAGRLPEGSSGSMRFDDYRALESVPIRTMKAPVFKAGDRYQSWVEGRADEWIDLIPTLHRERALHFAGVEWAQRHPDDATIDRGFGRFSFNEKETGYDHMMEYYRWEDALDEDPSAWASGQAPGRWTPDEVIYMYRWLWGHLEDATVEETAGAGPMPRVVFRPPSPREIDEVDDSAIAFGGEEIHFLINAERLADPSKRQRGRRTKLRQTPEGKWEPREETYDFHPDGRVIKATTAMHELAHLLAWRALNGEKGRVIGRSEIPKTETSWGHEETFAALARMFHAKIMGLLRKAADEAGEKREVVFNDDVQTLQWVRRNLMSKGVSPDEIYGPLKDDFEVWFDGAFHASWRPNQPGAVLLDPKTQQYRYGQKGPRWRRPDMPRADDGAYDPTWRDKEGWWRLGAHEPFDPVEGDPFERIEQVAAAIMADKPGISESIALRTAAREFAEDWSGEMPADRLAALVRPDMRAPAHTAIPGLGAAAAAEAWVLQTASEIAADVIWVSDAAAIKAATYLWQSQTMPPPRRVRDRVVTPWDDRDEWVGDRAGDWLELYTTMDEYTALHVAATEWSMARPLDRVDRGFGRSIDDEQRIYGEMARRYHEKEEELRSAAEIWLDGAPMGGRLLTGDAAVNMLTEMWSGYGADFAGVGAGRKPRLVFRAPQLPGEKHGDMYAITGREIHVVVESFDDYRSQAAFIDPLTLVHEVAHILAWRTLMGRPGNILGSGLVGHGVRTPHHSETFAGLVTVLAEEYVGLLLHRMGGRIKGGRTLAERWDVSRNTDIVSGEWARRNLMARGVTAEEIFTGIDDPLEIYVEPGLSTPLGRFATDTKVATHLRDYDFGDLVDLKRRGLLLGAEHRGEPQEAAKLTELKPSRIGASLPQDIYEDYMHEVGLPAITGRTRLSTPSTMPFITYHSDYVPFEAHYLPLVDNESNFFTVPTSYTGRRSQTEHFSHANWLLRVSTDTDGSLPRDVLSRAEVRQFHTDPKRIDFNAANNPTGRVVVDELQVPEMTLVRGYHADADGNLSDLNLPPGLQVRLLAEYRGTPDKPLHMVRPRQSGEPPFEFDDPERTFTADVYRIWVVDEGPTLTTESGLDMPLPSDIRGVDPEAWLLERIAERRHANNAIDEPASAYDRYLLRKMERDARTEYALIKSRAITNVIDPNDTWNQLGMADRPYPMRELFRAANTPEAPVDARHVDIHSATNMLGRKEYGVRKQIGEGSSHEIVGEPTWSRIFKLLVRDVEAGGLQLYRASEVAPPRRPDMGLVIPARGYDMSRIKAFHHLGADLGAYMKNDAASDLPVFQIRRNDPIHDERLDVTPEGGVWVRTSEGEIQLAEDGEWIDLTPEEMQIVEALRRKAQDDLRGADEIEDPWHNHLIAADVGSTGTLYRFLTGVNNVYEDMFYTAGDWVWGLAFHWGEQLRYADPLVGIGSNYARSHSRMIHGSSPHRNPHGITVWRGWSAWEHRWGVYEPQSRALAGEPVTAIDYDASSYDLNITLPFSQEGFGAGHAVLIETHMPYGTVGLHVGPGQLEHVLPPGTRWRYVYGQDDVVLTDSDWLTANPRFGYNKVIYRVVEPFALYGKASPVPDPLTGDDLVRHLNGLDIDDMSGPVEITLQRDIVAYMHSDLAELHGVENTLIPQAPLRHSDFSLERSRAGSRLDMRPTLTQAQHNAQPAEVPMTLEVHIPKGSRVTVSHSSDPDGPPGYFIQPGGLGIGDSIYWSLETIEQLYGERVPAVANAVYPRGELDRYYRVRYVDLLPPHYYAPDLE